mmetsp:Transcript_98817/g.299928  ORF Transcript_98817/g.299928 Transcript_98817/m.299928 type:complete len:249 (-) Transcript_98817:382-1128(-)
MAPAPSGPSRSLPVAPALQSLWAPSSSGRRARGGTARYWSRRRKAPTSTTLAAPSTAPRRGEGPSSAARAAPPRWMWTWTVARARSPRRPRRPRPTPPPHPTAVLAAGPPSASAAARACRRTASGPPSGSRLAWEAAGWRRPRGRPRASARAVPAPPPCSGPEASPRSLAQGPSLPPPASAEGATMRRACPSGCRSCPRTSTLRTTPPRARSWRSWTAAAPATQARGTTGPAASTRWQCVTPDGHAQP